jgi:hypothetical protein
VRYELVGRLRMLWGLDGAGGAPGAEEFFLECGRGRRSDLEFEVLDAPEPYAAVDDHARLRSPSAAGCRKTP